MCDERVHKLSGYSTEGVRRVELGVDRGQLCVVRESDRVNR